MAMSPEQLANLEKGKETRFKTGEKQAEIARQAGIASGESKRARKTLRAELELLLESHARDPKTGDQSEKTIQEAITLALITKALKGDTKAFEIIRDTIGEKPAERVNLGQIDQETIDEVEKMVMGCDP